MPTLDRSTRHSLILVQSLRHGDKSLETSQVLVDPYLTLLIMSYLEAKQMPSLERLPEIPSLDD